MSFNKIRYTENTLQVENTEQVSRKRSSSNATSHQGNKKTSGATSRRYKTLLTCVVCSGDAHGNYNHNLKYM